MFDGAYAWRRRFLATAILVASHFVVATMTWAADPDEPRARPPKWSADVLDVFFDDAREVLQGERPDYATLGETSSRAPIAESPRQDVASDADATSTWSEIIAAETVETEIKRLAQLVSQAVRAPTPFKGGGYKTCADHFHELSLLFAIAAQYEGDIRWQDSAAGLREQFAHAALSCETGSDEAFREATVRSQDLADLVRGSRPEIPAAEPAVDWGLLVERPPLMRRMEQSHQDGLTKWLATPTEFRRRRDDILHEAQLLAAVAHVIGQEGFDAWDDPPYAEYATELRAAAQAISSATEAGQYDPARAALGRATKACSNCHEYYRG